MSESEEEDSFGETLEEFRREENTGLLAPDGALSGVERERSSLVTAGSYGRGPLLNEKRKG